MTSDEIAESISICRTDGCTVATPENPALLLDTTSTPAPNSFDSEFLSQEKETTIRAWAILNQHRVISCVDIHRNEPSGSKTSCSIIENEFNLPRRREVFTPDCSLVESESKKLWMRDWTAHTVFSLQRKSNSLEGIGPFWGRDSFSSGQCITFLIIDKWCKEVSGKPSSRKLFRLSKRIAARLQLSIAFFVWWRESEETEFFLAKIERFPPDYLPDAILDEAVEHILQVLAS